MVTQNMLRTYEGIIQKFLFNKNGRKLRVFLILLRFDHIGIFHALVIESRMDARNRLLLSLYLLKKDKFVFSI